MARKNKPKSEASVVKKPRVLKTPHYTRWRYSKRIKHPGPKLASSWKILKGSLVVIKRNKRLFAGIMLVYLVLSLVLVRGFSSTAQLGTAKAASKGASQTSLATGFSLLGDLAGSSTSTANAAASTFQSILIVLMSLVIIWALRQAYANDGSKRTRIKTAFYGSTYPLIPFLILLLVISLQLIPLLIGSTVYSIVVTNGLAVGAERLIWGAIFFILTLVSFYLLTSSLFALYIVTLPDVTPMQALRSARELVRFRRWTVMRKILFLPLILLILAVIIMLPVVLWLTAIAEWVFFVLGLLVLLVIHAYMYSLYRELL